MEVLFFMDDDWDTKEIEDFYVHFCAELWKETK